MISWQPATLAPQRHRPATGFDDQPASGIGGDSENTNIDCTVTLRDASRLYACGHQVLAQGPAQFPLCARACDRHGSEYCFVVQD